MTDDDVEGLARRISEAPLAPETWPSVLADLAQAAGGWSGQLFAIAGGHFIFDVTGGLAPEIVDELNKRGGADPTRSPRPAALLRSPALTIQCDADYLTPEQRDRFPIYKDFFEPADSHFATTATLAIGKDSLVGAAVNHTAKQGAPSEQARKNLLTLLPFLNDAVQLQVRIEMQTAAFSLSALQSLQMPAIICDAFGAIAAINGLAEGLLLSGLLIVRQNNKLMAAAAKCRDTLQAAIERCALSNPPPIARVALHSADETDVAIADIAPLPSGLGELRLGARVLVALRASPSGEANTAHLLQLGLTHGEASVAAALAGGITPLEIAHRRGVSVETVRSQIKSIHAKLGVRRNAELIARLRHLL